MLKSMTGFATLTGAAEGYSWVWDLKSVNARGLDVRLRVPDWVEGLEQPLRAELGKSVARGSLSVALRVSRDESSLQEGIDDTALSRVLEQIKAVQTAADQAGVNLAPTTSGEVLSMRGVVSSQGDMQDTKPLAKAMLAQLPDLLKAFKETRQSEGQSLSQVLIAQLDRIGELTETAAALALARKDAWSQKLQENLARALEASDGIDQDRLAQEIATIVVKNDVTEEIDRLKTHVAAARDYLTLKEPVGRKLDFLAQEFNREANTLCSKAQSSDLTAVGLDLKAVIDQMREQVQNVE